MIIYGEDLAPTRFSASDLDKGGAHSDQWPGISNGLVERAEKQIAIEFGK